LNALLAAKHIPNYSFVVTMALTGTGPGELLPRRWKDVDWEHEMLSVTSNLECHTLQEKKPKNEYRNRFIPLLEYNLTVLREHFAGSKFKKPDDLIWPNESGNFMREDYVSKGFSKSLKDLGLRHIRLYDLRHGHITELLNAGVPDKQIQERVGHASATMTKDRYGHFMVGAQEQSIRDWERQRFAKTSDSEDGASDRNRTYDKRFTNLPDAVPSWCFTFGAVLGSTPMKTCFERGMPPGVGALCLVR
jgi:integrase